MVTTGSLSVVEALVVVLEVLDVGLTVRVVDVGLSRQAKAGNRSTPRAGELSNPEGVEDVLFDQVRSPGHEDQPWVRPL